MYSLLLDSSNIKLGVAIAKDDDILVMKYYDAWQRQSEFMMQEIDHVLKKAKVKPSDISKIIVSIGPGSYTGVRISLTIAKIWGICREIPVYPVSSLEILKDQESTSICLMNARSNRSYIGIYSEHKCIMKDCVKTNEEVLEIIKSHKKYEVCGETKYLNIKGYEANIFLNMLEISEHSKPISNIYKLKAIYLKD